MPLTLSFTRNRCTSVEQIDQKTLRSTCRLQDTLTDATVSIDVKLPDLEIVAVQGRFARTCRPECADVEQALPKVVGVRIGSGMLKIIRGLIGETTACQELAFMIEECCHGVILAFTKDTLVAVPETEPEKSQFFAQMVRDNIRLYNRCAAFAPGSGIVDGIEPPKPDMS
jgi:hypothetical protein